MTAVSPKREPYERLSEPMATLSAFLAMVKKEFIIQLRYPVEFVASFAQIFLIVLVLTFVQFRFLDRRVHYAGR